MTHNTRRIQTWAAVAAAGAAVLVVYSFSGAPAQAQAQAAPRYKFDPDWPKPLPNKWKMGGVTGLAVDKDDNVWVLNRPNDLTDIELHAELTPPTADCCVRPPSMIHIDKSGNVIGSFDAPQGHGMDVDSKGFAYLGQNTVRKYDTKTGKLVGEIKLRRRRVAHRCDAAVRSRSGPASIRRSGCAPAIPASRRPHRFPK